MIPRDFPPEKIDVTHDFFHQKKLILRIIFFPPEKIEMLFLISSNDSVKQSQILR